jgi:hypothetical protein
VIRARLSYPPLGIRQTEVMDYLECWPLYRSDVHHLITHIARPSAGIIARTYENSPSEVQATAQQPPKGQMSFRTTRA